MGKDSEWSGLLKLPAEVIISELRVKLGQQASYITELEDKLKEREKKEVKQSKLDHLEKENARLTQRLTDAHNRLSDVGQLSRRLEKQLLNLIKEQNEKTN